MLWTWLLAVAVLVVCGASVLGWAGWRLYRTARALGRQASGLSRDVDAVVIRLNGAGEHRAPAWPHDGPGTT